MVSSGVKHDSVAIIKDRAGADGYGKCAATVVYDDARSPPKDLEPTMAAKGSGNQINDSNFDSESVFPPSTSHVAALNRELKALEVRYFRTRLQLEKSMEKNCQLRHVMKKLRKENVKLERGGSKLRHLIDRIQADKKHLELQAINNRDYAKKIEQRFFMGTKGQSLVQRNVELSDCLKGLEKTVQDKDAVIEAQQRELQETHGKVQILKRALDTRFEELELNGSVHTGILFELSRLQDQCASLALQLSQERKTSKVLEVQLQQALAKEANLDETLVVREAWIATFEKERADLEQQLAQLANEKQTFAFEKSTLLKFIQEQAEVKFQLEAQMKQVQDAKVTELSALHQKLQLLIDEKQVFHDSLREANLQKEKVRQDYQTLEHTLQTEQREKEALQTRDQERFLEIQRLRDDLKKQEDDFMAAKDVCRELQAACDQDAAQIYDLNKKIEELETVIADLRHQVAQKQTEELALREAMENMLKDLEVLSKQRNDAAKAMNEAVTISASSLEEQQSLESKVETQRKQLEQLKHSKNLMQNAMLEQLAALRKQLQLERMQRIEADAKIKQLLANSTRSPIIHHHLSTHEIQVNRGDTVDANDPEEPRPSPPPSAASPPPLPPNLVLLNKKSDHYESSSSSSSSDEDDEEDEANVADIVNAEPVVQEYTKVPSNVVPLPVDRSSFAIPLAADEHQTTQQENHTSTPPSPHENVSLLELAGTL